MDDTTGKKNRLKMLAEAEEQVVLQVAKFFATMQNPKERIICVADVDDANGAEIANSTLPGFDWSSIREKGLHPIAIGTMTYEALIEFGRGVVTPEQLALKDEDTVLVAIVAYGGILVAEVALAAGTTPALMN
jgi:hypothetical protein